MPGQNQSAANISADVLIPGPQGSTVLKNILLNRSDDSLRRMVQLHQAYGDLVHLQIASRHIYLLFHPDDVQRVLQTNNRNYVKGELLDKLRVAAGNGLFTSEGDFWRRQRRMMQPFFHRTVIASFGEIMVAEIQQLLAQWDQYAAGGTACELQEQMMRVTLSVVAKALFTTGPQRRGAGDRPRDPRPDPGRDRRPLAPPLWPGGEAADAGQSCLHAQPGAAQRHRRRHHRRPPGARRRLRGTSCRC